MHERLPARASKVINTMSRERGGSSASNVCGASLGKTEQWEVTRKLSISMLGDSVLSSIRFLKKPKRP
jgi:hypothetical protein